MRKNASGMRSARPPSLWCEGLLDRQPNAPVQVPCHQTRVTKSKSACLSSESEATSSGLIGTYPLQRALLLPRAAARSEVTATLFCVDLRRINTVNKQEQAPPDWLGLLLRDVRHTQGHLGAPPPQGELHFVTHEGQFEFTRVVTDARPLLQRF